jgi:GT2 family glycosyltransferase
MSTDGSREWLDTEEPRKLLGDIPLEVIKNDENLGFGRANNIAMRAFPSDYYFLLNTDAFLANDAIDRLLAVARSEPDVGGVGPKLLNPDGSLQPSVGRFPPRFWDLPILVFRLYKLLPKKIRGNLLHGSFWDHAEKRDVTYISGAAFLLTNEALEATGGFDERFYMYAEDCDLCCRIVKAGFRLIFVPDAVVTHLGSQSAVLRWGDSVKSLKQTEAGLIFQQLHLSPLEIVLNCFSALVTLSAVKIWRMMHGVSQSEIDIQIRLYKAALLRQIGAERNSDR